MLSDNEKELAAVVRKKVLDALEYEGDITDEKMEEMVSKILSEEVKSKFLPYYRRIFLGKEIFN